MKKTIINPLLVLALSAGSLFAVAQEPTNTIAPTVIAAVTATTININTADAETLARELSGVGMAKAQAIVEYRDMHGPFASVDELIEVKGIGVAILERNMSKLSIE